MSILDSLALRRSYYKIGKELPVPQEKVAETIARAVELVPDAFDMKSSRVVVALNEHQDRLWDAVYDVFGGKVPREKIDSFKAGAGTVLYFYDTAVVKVLQEKYPAYAANFPVWANQASGMLQIAVWTALRELGVGASLQHYNPVIDAAVKTMFAVPESYALVAQMPFGGILEEPAPKEKEDMTRRVRVLR